MNLVTNMSTVKSAWELASERVIASRYTVRKKEVEEQRTTSKKFDFISIPEFEDKAEKAMEIVGYSDGGKYAEETKLIENPEEAKQKEQEKKETPVESIKIKEPESVHFEEAQMEVCWSGNFLDYGGFARMNRTMAFGLSNRNVKVRVEIEPYLTHVNASTQEQLREMSNTEISPEAPRVWGVTVPLYANCAGKKILYTMIETSERIHKDYIGKLNMMNEVWIASEYGRKLLSNNGVYAPIKVMPLGVDVNRYKPNCGVIDLGSEARDFKFISVFRWSYRKGFDILLRAYLEEFSNDEDVSLVLVSRNVESLEEVGPQKIIDDFNDIKSFVNKPEEELPHVSLYNKPIDERDMPKVYNSADAFVLISRGEGFCLPIVEASSCGLPVIASNVTSQTDYLREDNSYLVNPEGFIEARSGGNMARMAKLCHFYEGQMFPDFGEKTIQKTREHMRYVFENRKEAKEKNEKLRKLISSNYTWDMAVDRVYNRLKEIL